ncbi:MAG: phosphoglycerate kinase [Candidatus Micrarchaeia archaeon]
MIFDELPEGKAILLRVDLNTGLVNGEPQDSPRFTQAAETVRALLKKKSRVVIIAHQGRPGDNDYTSLEKHAALLSKRAKKKIKFVPDLFGPVALAAIKKLSPGKALLLENTRFYAEEAAVLKDYSQTLFVKQLSPLFDYYVNDAFSVSHRSQASLVGFPKVLPSVAGPHLAREVEFLSRLRSAERPVVYCLGGAKLEECLDLSNYALTANKADYLLVSGVFGDLLLLASGKDMGLKAKWLEEKGFTKHLPACAKLWAEYKQKLVLPVDWAFADADGFRVETREPSKAPKPVFDIGRDTVALFKRYLKDARTVFFKGPCGRYEEPAFEMGTQMLLKEIAKTNAVTVIGGGDSGAALLKLGLKEKNYGHVCTAGGAMLDYLTGKALPGLDALNPST